MSYGHVTDRRTDELIAALFYAPTIECVITGTMNNARNLAYCVLQEKSHLHRAAVRC